jgi:hypothetical protein
LRESGPGGHGNRHGENRANKDSTDAVKAHGVISPMGVMGPCSGTMCSKFAAMRHPVMFHDNPVNFDVLVPSLGPKINFIS